jgi:4-hydroxy-2-oxoheptanedioate aldolase
VRHASENTRVAVQLEDASALDHAGEVARTERVDAVFIGPTDLSISLGGNVGLRARRQGAAAIHPRFLVNRLTIRVRCDIMGA